jgi:hypothetical protein
MDKLRKTILGLTLVVTSYTAVCSEDVHQNKVGTVLKQLAEENRLIGIFGRTTKF